MSSRDTRRVQVVIEGRTIYDEQVRPADIIFSNRDRRIQLFAGPGTALSDVWAGLIAQSAVR